MILKVYGKHINKREEHLLECIDKATAVLSSVSPHSKFINRRAEPGAAILLFWAPARGGVLQLYLRGVTLYGAGR